MKPLAGLTTVICWLTTFMSATANMDSFDSNGTRIQFTVEGEGPAVVLVHGFIGSRADWLSPPPYLAASEREDFETIFAALAKDYRVIAFDCRGHGRSGKPSDEEDYGMEMVEDIVRLLDHLDIEQAHVVGYSMGAFLSAKLMTTHPERVSSVFLGGGGAMLEGSDQLSFMIELGESLESGRGVEPLIIGLTPSGQATPTQEQIDQANAMFLANQDEQALALVALGHRDLVVSEQELRSCEIPTQLYIGGNDPLKASAENTARLHPAAKLYVSEGHDHVSAMLSPDFLDSIQSFLEEN